MSDVKVKICGLQSVEVLKSMINLPVDYIGFVFAPSKRKVSGQQAASLISVLQDWNSQNGTVPQSVGVFMNPTMAELEDILTSARLDVLQLHGAESPEFCREARERFGLQVFKVLSVSIDGALRSGHALEDYEGVIDGLLLDTYDPQYGGGSGKTFPWDIAVPYKTWARQRRIPFLVAGGLHIENVSELIDSVAPDGVDVSSGVETDGIKDITKIASFVERVKGI